MEEQQKARYHLPGLFEFYELYKNFLPLFFEHREYFYEEAEIASIYGAPTDCLWGGGRIGLGGDDAGKVLSLMREYGISARLTFSNSMLREAHLTDTKCNRLCELFEKGGTVSNGIILHSELLLSYLKKNYPGFYFVSSTTKVLTEFTDLKTELLREDFGFVVPDFRFNNRFDLLDTLTQAEKSKAEFLCNECCWTGCRDRKACYENVSRRALGEDCPEHRCAAPGAAEGYRFSRAMKSPAFIGRESIIKDYLPRGFSHFKLEGRNLGSAIVLEFLLFYLVKPEHQMEVREAIYLDSMLDLF